MSITKQAIEKAFEDAVKQDNLCPVGKLIVEHEHGGLIGSKVKDELHYSAATIARVLKSLDVAVVSAEMVSKHRRGICRCKP